MTREQAPAAGAPALRLPPLPTDPEARAQALEKMAAEIVEHFGPVTAAALSAWIDDVVADHAAV